MNSNLMVTIAHTYEQLKNTVASLTSRIGDLEAMLGRAVQAWARH